MTKALMGRWIVLRRYRYWIIAVLIAFSLSYAVFGTMTLGDVDWAEAGLTNKILAILTFVIFCKSEVK